MEKRKPERKVVERALTLAEQGQAYLKSALVQDNEEVFLQALHRIIDSLVYYELNMKKEEHIVSHRN